MSMKYIGETIDIHGGGLENQFPHHECEIAQSEAATGKPFVRYWLHNNMVTVDGRKMGKSLGNFTTLKDAFTRWNPEVVRFFVLQSHYRSTLDFSEEALAGAARGHEKLSNTVRNLREALRRAPDEGPACPIDLDRHRKRFVDVMDEDVNTPQALAVLFDLAHEVNQMLAGPLPARASVEPVAVLFEELGGRVLGLRFGSAGTEGSEELVTGLMEVMIGVRAEIRAQKLWALSDRIRDGLSKLGIALEDKKEGTTWKRG
jgi:cysteinyl-tRNA synthetase